MNNIICNIKVFYAYNILPIPIREKLANRLDTCKKKLLFPVLSRNVALRLSERGTAH